MDGVAHKSRRDPVVALRAAIAMGKPWMAKREMGTLSESIEPRTWAALDGLMDECPHFEGVLAGDGQHGELTFLSTESHLRSAKSFLESLCKLQVR